MSVEPTSKNSALASAVNSRINAEAMMVSAKAAGLRLAALGGLMFLAGAGVGIAFFGYSYLVDSTSASERVGEAMAKALERSVIKTAGTVSIDPSANKVALEEGGKVGVDPNATVKLDSTGATVRLDPSSQVPRPSQAQLSGTGAAPQRPNPVVTNFTIFKSVKFGSGNVHTGWKFRSTDEAAPYHQYCYFGQDMEG